MEGEGERGERGERGRDEIEDTHTHTINVCHTVCHT